MTAATLPVFPPPALWKLAACAAQDVPAEQMRCRSVNGRNHRLDRRPSQVLPLRDSLGVFATRCVTARRVHLIPAP